MYFYFSSDYPCALKINGAYAGLITDSVKSCELDLLTPSLVELCPLIEGERTCTFVLDGSFNGKITGASVTDLKGGYLIKPVRYCRAGGFAVLAQERFNGFGVTVFKDDGLKISIESEKDFFADTVYCPCNEAQINAIKIDGLNACAVLLKGENTLLFTYALDGKICKVMEKRVDEVRLDGGLKTTERLTDIAKHVITCEWGHKNGRLYEKNRTVTRDELFNPAELPNELKPFAFLEELLSGGEVTEYLTGGMKLNADKLYGFFGESIGVMPPPPFRDVNEVGLIYKTTENEYCAQYYVFEFENGLICNVKKLD